MVYTGHFVVQSAWPKIQLVSAGALLFFQHECVGGGGGVRGREGAGIFGQFGCVLCNHFCFYCSKTVNRGNPLEPGALMPINARPEISDLHL